MVQYYGANEIESSGWLIKVQRKCYPHKSICIYHYISTENSGYNIPFYKNKCIKIICSCEYDKIMKILP